MREGYILLVSYLTKVSYLYNLNGGYHDIIVVLGR